MKLYKLINDSIESLDIERTTVCYESKFEYIT